MGIEIGSLRHQVTLQRSTPAVQPGGEETASWADVGDFWAFVESLGGREQFYARQVIATASHRVTMRQGTAVLETDRFRWVDPTGSTLYLNADNVSAVGNLNEFFVVLCTERKS